MTVVTLNDLTTGVVTGNGVFDKLMAATKAHLEVESKKGSIKGPEYATVYLGQVQACMAQALAFLQSQQRIGLEAQLLEKQIAQVEAQTALTNQQKENEILQGNVLIAQECLLKAQYTNTVQTTLKVAAETDLLKQKIVTEKAQTLELGVDENSVIGKQKTLYSKQAAGFDRDAEQKAAQLWVSSWNSRRMTDEGTVADGTNKLDDVTGGRLMTKLLAGVNA